MSSRPRSESLQAWMDTTCDDADDCNYQYVCEASRCRCGSDDFYGYTSDCRHPTWSVERVRVGWDGIWGGRLGFQQRGWGALEMAPFAYESGAICRPGRASVKAVQCPLAACRDHRDSQLVHVA